MSGLPPKAEDTGRRLSGLPPKVEDAGRRVSGLGGMRVGWCPGALRPMMAGDGLLVRIKPRAAGLSASQCLAVADLSRRFGNGIINITGRGNLQLRGVQPAGVDQLVSCLDALDLLDATPDGEAVRNVIASPLAGHDPDAIVDIRAIVTALEDRLAADPALWRLPPKFAWSVDDGGYLSVADRPVDVGFEATVGPNEVRFAIRLDGGDVVGSCSADAVVPTAQALAASFLELCAVFQLEPHRMRDLVAHVGAKTILAHAGVSRADIPARERPEHLPIGVGRRAASSWVGVAPPFGRLEAGGLAAFASAVASGPIRATPWRTLLVPGLDEAEADRIWASVKGQFGGASSLIVDPSDPRLRVAACSGAPACLRATTPVQEDAGILAAALIMSGSGTLLHVSGCAKGCAHPEAAAMTLVGREGIYDLVRDGKAGDRPETQGLTRGDMLAIMVDRAQSVGYAASSRLREQAF